MKTTKLLGLFAIAALLLTGPVFGAAQIVIVNTNAPGVGFNDPTPAVPVGGNPGTTVGQQRLNAFQYAADIWGSILSSPVPIYIQSSFTPLACTATAATLGSAGALQVFGDFPNAELADTWYHVALANKLAGADLAPGPNGTSADDIVARFNSNLGQPTCLAGIGWYYGLDTNHGTNIDLVTVLLHEFGHGLGFSGFYNKIDRRAARRLPGRLRHLHLQHHLQQGLAADDGRPARRPRPSTPTTWSGPASTSPPRCRTCCSSARRSSPSTRPPPWGATGSAPRPSARSSARRASPATSSSASTRRTSPARRPRTAARPSPPTCTGKIGLVDRGTCGFAIKAKNLQNAGAIAVLIADNVAGSPPAGMSGTDPTITIPSVRISLANGNALKSALASGTVNVTLGVNLAVRAGANPAGKALLNAPNPVVTGSSISHWDPIAFPNLLMEPSINSDLTHGVDLTRQEMTDIGWFSDGDGVADGVDQCIGSSTSATVVIDGCNSGVANTTFATGCRISDQINDCAVGAGNHGAFVSCVANLTNTLKKQGVISGNQKGAIQSCAAHASH